MTLSRGKPIHLTHGERELVVAACETAIKQYEATLPLVTKEENKHICRLRCRQYRRIIREIVAADPVAKDQ